MTNSVGIIAPPKMKLETRRWHRIKAHTCLHVISSRELIPTEQLRAELDQRSPAHTFLPMRRWANTILTGITLRQFSTCSASHDIPVIHNVRQHSENASEI